MKRSGERGGKYQRRNAPVKRIDPRDFYPELVDLLDDLDVEIWNDDPYCLCGCKQPTQQETSAQVHIPPGAFRLWINGHYARTEWVQVDYPLTDQQTELRNRRRGEGKPSIDTAAIAILLTEWQARTHQDFGDLARQVGMRTHYIREIATYERQRIELVNAARILLALGETLRPELRHAYRRWRERHALRGQRHPHS